eukprot:comp21468_c0_seq1/m.29718 comp21468_c0_seq1/g.29718  ORF comp21468_c0_seq1/g.29718 comp21468_c0_seq1/m.29718 type:complete len:400 (-) comp21468_c0_seq1:225-1424(-)
MHLLKNVAPALGGVSHRFMATAASGPLKLTALDAFHKAHGGKMVPFCGWNMPLQYSDLGIIDSHLFTRSSASIFDVSHMLQLRMHGMDRVKFIEKLVVGNIAELENGNGTLSLITNEKGGIKDDTIINNADDHLYVVCNAGCADKDLAHFQEHASAFRAAGGDVTVEVLEANALLALQGPKAAAALSKLVKVDLSKLYFMMGTNATVAGVDNCRITRCGYTGEDGFEISIPKEHVASVASALLADPTVKMAGLGARDSLRLEAGLCLYGNDITEETTPIEASLAWTIGKRRRTEGGFLGSDVILDQLKNKGGNRRLVGLAVAPGAPAREKCEIIDASGNTIGITTSGQPSPSLKANIAMAYVDKKFAKSGTEVQVKVRKNIQPAKVTKMPFVPSNYYRQ